MCGLIAAIRWHGTVDDRAGISAACTRMAPRGPDAQGLWQENGVTLGHRRLAILDLDPRSHQPMVSQCGRYVIVFNGEIYNFRELRRQREALGDVFHTTSDTEVLLAWFAAEGAAMLPRLRGMFAFFIWDRQARRGFAARDPYGIKPLYYAPLADGLLIGSQVKALLATGQVSRQPDLGAQAAFWVTGNVPEPRTWYRAIRAVPAGGSLWVAENTALEPQFWWDIRDDWRQAAGARLPAGEVRESVRAALQDSVRAHLVADVPVGVFLSGGIDSGALAGLMRDVGAADLQGVTIRFEEFAGQHEDETPVAALIARHYGVAHHIRTITRDEFTQDLPRIIDAMDQPSDDGVNTWFASKAVAEQGLKVVVSGLGGDELFHGYPTFRQLPWLVGLWRPASRLPGALALARWACNLQARRTGNSRWALIPDWARYFPTAWLLLRGMFPLGELPALMGEETARAALQELDPAAWAIDQAGRLPAESGSALALIESVGHLRNQLLRDSDWTSMAHSVELRTPLVDAWLLRELRARLNAFPRFPNKRLLAQAPVSPLPEAVIQRRKTGFGTPVELWLQQMGKSEDGRRGWVRELISSAWNLDSAPGTAFGPP